MSLPDDVLSDVPVPYGYGYGRALSVSKIVDYETGGIALNDPSQGHLVQVWRARIINDGANEALQHIVLDAEQVAETTIYSANDITEVSISFDQNMRLHYAWIEAGEAKFNWYDTALPGFVVTNYGAAVITPRITLDDKRINQDPISDVILAYLKADNLYCRYQRDRYTIEYLLASNVESPGLIKVGMNKGLRLQFMLKNTA